MQLTTEKGSEIQAIQEELREMSGYVAEYVLYRISTGKHLYFALEIISGEEWDMHILGDEEVRAQRLYEIFVNEAVTPCTMRDILHDINIEEEERRYRQNLCKI